MANASLHVWLGGSSQRVKAHALGGPTQKVQRLRLSFGDQARRNAQAARDNRLTNTPMRRMDITFRQVGRLKLGSRNPARRRVDKLESRSSKKGAERRDARPLLGIPCIVRTRMGPWMDAPIELPREQKKTVMNH